MNADYELIAASGAADAAAETVGGKGRQLGLLHRYGLPVPDFFVIPAAWSERRGAGVADELRERLAAELAARGWLATPLAVRSSAVGEDAASASFAGIYRSLLNICGLDALTAAVGEVWASLDTPGAAAYRERLGLADAAMAVVVMPLLAAEASGIAFTCDPLSGRGDRLLVHAHWGLGETLVGGEAAGDEYVFAEDAEDSWRLIESRRGSKATVSVPAPGGGTERQALPAARAQAAVLDAAAAESLAALLWDAALALDFVAPFYDLEWVWDGAAFWLTQARPVTRRPPLTYPGLAGQSAIWTRGNTCEVMPEPLSPMDWAFSRRGVNHLLEPGWQLTGQALLPGAQRAGLFDGRLYLEAAIMQWEAWDTVGLAPARFNAMMGGHQPAIAVPPAGWRDRLRRLANTLRYVRRAPALRQRGEAEVAAALALAREIGRAPLPAEPDRLAQSLRRLLRSVREGRGLHFLQGSGGGSLALLLDTLERLFPGESAALGAALLAGGEASVTARQGYALLALAQLAKAAAERGRPQDDPEFAAAFAAFLDDYGHRGHYETYLRNPRWREAPERLLEQLPALAEVDADALRERQRAAAAAAWQRLRREAPWWAGRLLRAQVKAANRDCNQREAARSALIALLAAGRRLWLAVAERMCAGGLLARPGDIFLLLPSEAERASAGRIPAAGLGERIAARAAIFAGWQAATPAEWLSVAAAGVRVAGSQAPVTAAAGDAWRGVATGTGRVRGKARILRHPAEGGRLQAGEILVAPSTDPGWTPLFLRAGGLVVETGGYLSHGAIVAREFALPAVVNLPGILAQLADGDEIEVDGLSGEVRRLAPGTNGAPAGRKGLSALTTEV